MSAPEDEHWHIDVQFNKLGKYKEWITLRVHGRETIRDQDYLHLAQLQDHFEQDNWSFLFVGGQQVMKNNVASNKWNFRELYAMLVVAVPELVCNSLMPIEELQFSPSTDLQPIMVVDAIPQVFLQTLQKMR